jgi:hypothetical protein
MHSENEEWQDAFNCVAHDAAETWIEERYGGHPHPDDGFYDDLALLSDSQFFRRLEILQARHGPFVKHQGFEALPPFERRVRRPMRLPRAPVVQAATSRFPTYHPELDPLLAIPADEFVAVLTGEDAQGPYILCPLPDHDDRKPSCSLNDRLWRCFSCNRGGSIYDLAGYLWGIEPPLRGRAFGEVRDRLKLLFGVDR